MATDNKYDRQLRLWGSDGQKCLSEASILLINATAAGTETLKNLILPGVGFITILDDKLIEERDLGNNFFITSDSIGSSRAETTMKLLLELNDDVKGTYIHEAPNKYINSIDNADFFKQFSLVIACDITDNEFRNLTEVSDKFNLPIVVIRSYGMIGYLRSYVKEHTCIQSKHADKEPEDLRLSAPFPALEKFAIEFDMKSLDNMEHKHVPYAIILIKAVHEWKEIHNGKIPANMAEKEEFKTAVKSMARAYHDELNFIEAIENAYKCFNYEAVPFEIQTILDDEKASSQNYHSKFWTLVSALKQFVEENGCLPVSGKITDMISTSDFYITLQKVYQKKAKEDRDRITEILSQQADQKGLMDIIFEDDEIKTFCENARSLEVTRFHSFIDEVDLPFTEDISAEFFEPESSIQWYIAIRSAEMFRTKNARYPGQSKRKIDEDVSEMTEYAYEVIAKLDADDSFDFNDDYLFEIARFSNSTLHNIGAFLGGVASQEIVKLLTHQYTPMNHTFIFDGTHCKSQVFNP